MLHVIFARKQQVDRGELSPCGTPTGLDGRDPFDLQLGSTSHVEYMLELMITFCFIDPILFDFLFLLVSV